jgi:hypothetical protein
MALIIVGIMEMIGVNRSIICLIENIAERIFYGGLCIVIKHGISKGIGISGLECNANSCDFAGIYVDVGDIHKMNSVSGIAYGQWSLDYGGVGIGKFGVPAF